MFAVSYLGEIMRKNFNDKRSKMPPRERKTAAEKYKGRTAEADAYDEVIENMPKNMRRPVLIGIAAAAAILLLFFLLNDSFFHIEGVPTLNQLFENSGLSSQTDTVPDGDVLKVHYVDVGQGDCQLIVSSSETVLIDCGEREYCDKVIDYIKALGIDKLDYVVVSHPHTDHMGGMSYILDEFDIGTVIMPKIKDSLMPTTNAFQRMLKSIDAKGIKVDYAEVGKRYGIGGASMTVLSPVKDYDDLNNYSVAVKISHGENTFLFTGDIEKQAETDILSSGSDVSATVLKAAHHGSGSSSCKEFIDAVNPKYVVIEVGKGNDYGHPHKETLNRIKNRGLKLFRTDVNGNIVFTSTGGGLTVQPQKG